MSKEAATAAFELVEVLTRQAVAAGASSVIVMIGMPDGAEHSAYGFKSSGRCLELRGLLETCAEQLRPAIRYPDKP